MADSLTTNYDLVKPEVGQSADTWGGKLNANMDILDENLKAVSDKADAVTTSEAKGRETAYWLAVTM